MKIGLLVVALAVLGLSVGDRARAAKGRAAAQSTPPPNPTAAPPVATCVATPRPGGLYPDLVVWPPQFTLVWAGCPNPDSDPLVLRVQVENLGNGPATGFWVRAEGCTLFPVQARVPELVNGDRVTVDLAPVGGDQQCRVLADAECEIPDRYRTDNYWEGLVPELTPPPTCTATPATPTLTATEATATPRPTAPPRFVAHLPWARQTVAREGRR